MLAAIGLLLATMVLTAVPSDHPRPCLLLEMDLERGVSLTADDLQQIAAGVRRIWAPVLDVDVSAPGTTRPSAVETLHVIITNRTLPDTAHTGLAWIGFVTGEPQREITVSVSAARNLLDGGAWGGRPFSTLPKRAAVLFLQRAVTRALAHEIGHYLLRSPSHTARGLMRAVFTVDEIMNSRPSLERIDAQSLARLRRQGLFARAEDDVNQQTAF